MSASFAQKGCASKPIDKKKVAVFGAGGYLGMESHLIHSIDTY